jgi:hypothetical protein
MNVIGFEYPDYEDSAINTKTVEKGKGFLKVSGKL